MKVSVIIPVYNQENLIERAIKSVPKGWEIIVIDDASADDTVKVVEQYKTVKLIKNEKNLGVGLTRNKGIEVATGEYLLFLDSDDYFYTDKILKVAEHLEEYDMVFYNLRNNDFTVMNITVDNYFHSGGMHKFIKRSFLGETRFPDMKWSEDYYFTLELKDKEPTTKFTKIVAYHYNSPRENSLSDQRRKQK